MVFAIRGMQASIVRRHRQETPQYVLRMLPRLFAALQQHLQAGRPAALFYP